jgi:hypothetical protein
MSLWNNHAAFILAWNEFSDNVLRGFACRICHEQFEVVRDGAGFSIGILCMCPAAAAIPDFAQAELN